MAITFHVSSFSFMVRENIGNGGAATNTAAPALSVADGNGAPLLLLPS